MDNHIDVNQGLIKLKESGNLFKELFSNGTLSVEVYKPKQVDLQEPHTRDEVYIIISGSGTFVNDGMETTFNTGDFLFVKAGAEHRFQDFSDDFVTWVFFYGPEGGEQEQ